MGLRYHRRLPAGGDPAMTADRRTRVMAMLAEQDHAMPMADRVCLTSVAILAVSGAGLSLMGGAQGHRVLVHGTNDRARRLEDLQQTLGVGPCEESVRTGGPVLVPDLEQQPPGRWPEFVRPAVESGIRAVFAFPLQIGAISLGALDLYRDEIGGLSDEDLADALILSDVATSALLVAPFPGADRMDENLDGDVLTEDWIAGAGTWVYQASGMVMVQLGIPIDQAMLRLRAYAFVHGRTVTDVARDIVGRELRLTEES
jgi:hypothetical protein